MKHYDIILFDGTCNLCSGTVQFIVPKEKGDRFRYTGIQTKKGQEIAKKHALIKESQEINSIVLISGEKAYTKSTAALKIASQLKFPWNLFSVGWIMPRAIRDRIYDLVAKNRYKWFGRRTSGIKDLEILEHKKI